MHVDGVALREVCGWKAGTFTAGGPVGRWTQALRAASPVVAGRGDPAAARYGIAAGVELYRTVACRAAVDGDDPLQPLRAHLPALLATCGPPGTLAATAPPDVAAVAGRLTERLLTTVDERWGG